MRISSFVRPRPKRSLRLRAAATFAAAFLASIRPPAHSAVADATASPAPAGASAPSDAAAARQPIAAVRPQPRKSAEYRLIYKFRANEDVRMPLSVDAQIVVQRGPAAQTTTSQSTVERHFHVVSVAADGSAIVQLFIDNVRLSYGFNGGTPIVFDSNKKDQATGEFQKVQESIGPRGIVRFSPQGKVLSLTGGKPDPSTDPSESFLDLLPEKPLHVGDEWSDDIKVKVSVGRGLNQKITLRRRYILESVDGNVATIRLFTVEIPPAEDPQIRAQLVQRTPEGTIKFDLERGLVTSRELTCSRTETGIMEGSGMIAATTHWKGWLR